MGGLYKSMDFSYLIKEAKYYNRLNGLKRAFKKFILTQTPFKKIVNTPVYNRFYARAIVKKSRVIEPKVLQIENTNLCNAKCVMCPHTIMKRKGKIMTLNDFKKILENVDYKIKRLTITGFGEPFMDSGLIDKINFVNEKYPWIKIDIYTNASLLTPEITDKLVKTKLDRITFSINGTRANYGKIMGLDYEKTKANVLYFLSKNKKTLTNISLMILKENEKEIKEFMDFWREKADSVRVYMPSNWAGSLSIPVISKTGMKQKRWPCSGLWMAITVDVNGNMIMCCRDYESKVSFGNLLKEKARKIRQGQKFQELLKKHLDYNYSSEICKSCDNSFDSSLDWIC
jgi:radical SAM protein with 4Fe4S-binding SPASM domain